VALRHDAVAEYGARVPAAVVIGDVLPYGATAIRLD
jgi:hypothetical protein